MEEITDENLKDIDLKELATNKDLGRLNFETILPGLQDVRSLFIDLDELDYQGKLTDPEINSVDQHRKRLIKLLNELRSFDIGQADSQQRHDNLENEIKNFRENVWQHLRNPLVYLRQDAELGKEDVQELQEERKALLAERKKAEALNVELSKELDKLRQQQSAKASVKGEIAAETFGKHFESSADEYRDVAENRWYRIGLWSFAILFGVVVINFVGYLGIFFGEKIGKLTIQPTDVFTLEYGLVKLAILLLLSYVVGFSSRQYSINSHLSASNRHRKNVAETMKDFYESDLDESAKGLIIDRGTEAMFKNLPIGHISKSEHRDNDGPIHQVINQIPKITSKE